MASDLYDDGGDQEKRIETYPASDCIFRVLFSNAVGGGPRFLLGGRCAVWRDWLGLPVGANPDDRPAPLSERGSLWEGRRE